MSERWLSTWTADAQVKSTTWKKCLGHAITPESVPCHQTIAVLKMSGPRVPNSELEGKNRSEPLAPCPGIH